MGGICRLSAGLRDEFGDNQRVRYPDFPKTRWSGAGVGAALTGLRPVVELQFADFLFTACDEVVLKAGMWRYGHGGAYTVPLVIRCPSGAAGVGPEHGQCPEAFFMHAPGLKIVSPSTPADAKGLLKSAIRDDNAVLFFEHKLLYATKGEVPDGDDHLVPLGKAAIRREGDALTLVAISNMVPRALKAAERLAKDGHNVEVIDPRSLVPFDRGAIIDSVKKTGKIVVAEESCIKTLWDRCGDRRDAAGGSAGISRRVAAGSRCPTCRCRPAPISKNSSSQVKKKSTRRVASCCADRSN